MNNSRLALSLLYSGLSDEDISNITRIFDLLSDERKIHIISNIDTYIARFKAEKIKKEQERQKLLEFSYLQANDILDEAIRQYQNFSYEKKLQKNAIKGSLSTI